MDLTWCGVVRLSVASCVLAQFVREALLWRYLCRRPTAADIAKSGIGAQHSASATLVPVHQNAALFITALSSSILILCGCRIKAMMVTAMPLSADLSACRQERRTAMAVVLELAGGAAGAVFPSPRLHCIRAAEIFSPNIDSEDPDW